MTSTERSSALGGDEAASPRSAQNTPNTAPASYVSGLIERLRARRDHTFHGKGGGGYINRDGPEAADLIERLSAEREGLRQALEPFAALSEWFHPAEYEDTALLAGGHISAGQLRATRAALSTPPAAAPSPPVHAGETGDFVAAEKARLWVLDAPHRPGCQVFLHGGVGAASRTLLVRQGARTGCASTVRRTPRIRRGRGGAAGGFGAVRESSRQTGRQVVER